jgi:DNA-binding transcriptional MerR regulator
MLTYAQIAPILAAMSDSTPLTLDELAQQSGLEPRTIRSYVQADLIPRPSKRGRGATYEASALHRLEAIKLLKSERRMSLNDIRLLFEQCTDDQIRELASGEAVAPMLVSQAHGVDSPRAPLGDARASWPADRMPASLADPSMPDPPEGIGSTELENLFGVLRSFTASKRFSSSSTAEIWTRVEITKDIELNVRGIRGERDRYMLQQIADRIRVILKKGGVPTD